jgi:hypothetical protein
VAQGQQVTFQVTLSKGDATAKWLKNGKELTYDSRIQNIIDGKIQKIVIQDVSDDDAAEYTCKLGDKRCSARLDVRGKYAVWLIETLSKQIFRGLKRRWSPFQQNLQYGS